MKRSHRRLMFWILALVLIGVLVLPEVLDPYGGKSYTEISHGNHTHFVPRDRDEDVPLDRFPTTPPAPGERILPDGRVVRQ